MPASSCSSERVCIISSMPRAQGDHVPVVAVEHSREDVCRRGVSVVDDESGRPGDAWHIAEVFLNPLYVEVGELRLIADQADLFVQIDAADVLTVVEALDLALGPWSISSPFLLKILTSTTLLVKGREPHVDSPHGLGDSGDVSGPPESAST